MIAPIGLALIVFVVALMIGVGGRQDEEQQQPTSVTLDAYGRNIPASGEGLTVRVEFGSNGNAQTQYRNRGGP